VDSDYDYGILLFNFSSTASASIAAGGGGPAASCVDNWGSIPTISVVPGSLDEPTSANQNIEFRSNTDCDIFADHPGPWVYPFAITLNGESQGNSNSLALSYGPLNNKECSLAKDTAGVGYESLTGISQWMDCYAFSGSPDHGMENLFYSNTPSYLFPTTASGATAPYYLVAQMIAGPGSGLPVSQCSAGNWINCALFQIYDAGQGPCPQGLDSCTTGLTAPTASLAFTQPSSESLQSGRTLVRYRYRPRLLEVRLQKRGDRIAMIVPVHLGEIPDSVRNSRGWNKPRRQLDLTVLASSAGGKKYRSALNRWVYPKQTEVQLVANFDASDSAMLLAELANGGRIGMELQLYQVTSTRDANFVLPAYRKAYFNYKRPR